MIALPLLIIALAAGVYLLIKVKREYLGSIFEILAWLVILLSLVSIGFIGARGLRHCCGNKMGGGKCQIEKEIIVRGEGAEHEMGVGCPHAMGGCSMGGCKMEGDSVVMEKEQCEKMMGKEACEKMCAERGRCIMSKDECMKMCHSNGKPCSMDANGGEGMKKCEGEKKECCKHKM